MTLGDELIVATNYLSEVLSGAGDRVVEDINHAPSVSLSTSVEILQCYVVKI